MLTDTKGCPEYKFTFAKRLDKSKQWRKKQMGLCLEMECKMDGKDTFWSPGDSPHLDYGSSYLGVCICQNSSYAHVKCVCVCVCYCFQIILSKFHFWKIFCPYNLQSGLGQLISLLEPQ